MILLLSIDILASFPDPNSNGFMRPRSAYERADYLFTPGPDLDLLHFLNFKGAITTGGKTIRGFL
jgi:hypothetical protein